MNKIQSLKGFRDFLPEKASKRQWLKNKIVTIFEQWGYGPMETPTLEPLALFAGQIGEDEKLFFKFQDPGGRDVALRYDQTVPTCRVIGQYGQQLTMPFRRYQIQNAYRAENTQRGRYREFLQCDADIFGSNSPIADAEVIALGLEIYKQIGFPQAKVLINDRSLLSDMPYEVIVAIDKIDKIGESGVVEDMIKKGIQLDQAKKYLEIVRNLQPNQTIQIILSYLKNLGYDSNWYEFTPTIARSFSYSTGPIWEIIIPGFTGGSVLGGERYDKLIEKIAGVSIPGTGFGLGFDRTLEAAEQFNLIPEINVKSKILVSVFNQDLLNQSLSILKQLREKQVTAEIYPDTNTKLGKQFQYADKRGIESVIIIGDDEAKNGLITVKNMKTSEQKTLKIDEFIL